MHIATTGSFVHKEDKSQSLSRDCVSIVSPSTSEREYIYVPFYFIGYITLYAINTNLCVTSQGSSRSVYTLRTQLSVNE